MGEGRGGELLLQIKVYLMNIVPTYRVKQIQRQKCVVEGKLFVLGGGSQRWGYLGRKIGMCYTGSNGCVWVLRVLYSLVTYRAKEDQGDQGEEVITHITTV
jgi:hypothetical protein